MRRYSNLPLCQSWLQKRRKQQICLALLVTCLTCLRVQCNYRLLPPPPSNLSDRDSERQNPLNRCDNLDLRGTLFFFPFSLTWRLLYPELNALFSHTPANVENVAVNVLRWDFGAWFYTKLVNDAVKVVPSVDNFEADVLRRQALANVEFCRWFQLNKKCFPTDTGTTYVIFWGYVMYNVDFKCIPKSFIILSLENKASRGATFSGQLYENGCFNRCLMLPYVTEHSFNDGIDGKMNTYRGLSSPWSYREPFDAGGLSTQQYISARPYILSFAGSFNRTSTIDRYRHRWKQVCRHFGDAGVCMSGEELHRNGSVSYLNVYRRSIFCLILRGDTITRKAFYDALMEGCVPIVDATSAMAYESLYMGIYKQLIRSAIVTIPDEMQRSTDLIDLIYRAKLPAQLDSRLKACAQLSRQIAYSSLSLNGETHVSKVAANLARGINMAIKMH